MRSWLPALLLLTACGSEPQAGQGPGPDASQPQPKLELLVSHQSVDFGEVELGRRGQRSLTLQNAGSVTVEVQPIVLPAQDAFEVPTEVIRLPPGGEREIELSFAPIIEASYAARVRWTQRGQPGLGPETLLVGVGTPRAMPSDLGFGRVLREREVRVVRRMTVPLDSDAWSLQPHLQGGLECPFRPGQSGFCLEGSGRRMEVGPGGTFDLALRFRGLVSGERITDRILFRDCANCRVSEIPVEAEVVDQPLACAVRTLPGAKQGDCVDSFIDCGNEGPIEVAVVSATSNQSHFALGAVTPGPVSPGQAWSVPIRHCRRGPATETATVTVTTEPAATAPVVVVVRAPPPRASLLVQPSELDFRDGEVGDPRKRYVYLSQAGDVPVQLREVIVEGPNAREFAVQTTALPQVNDHRVEVTLTATSAGFKEAELVIRSDGDEGERRVPMFGRGSATPCHLEPFGKGLREYSFPLGYVPPGRSTYAYPFTVGSFAPCRVEIISTEGSAGLIPPPLGRYEWPPLSLVELPFEIDVSGSVGSTFAATLALTLAGAHETEFRLTVRGAVGQADLSAVHTVHRTCSGMNEVEIRPNHAGIEALHDLMVTGFFDAYNAVLPSQEQPWRFADGAFRISYLPSRRWAGPELVWLHARTEDDARTLELRGQGSLRSVVDHFDVEPEPDPMLSVLLVLDGSPNLHNVGIRSAVIRLLQEAAERRRTRLAVTTTDPEQRGKLLELVRRSGATWLFIDESELSFQQSLLEHLLLDLSDRPESSADEHGFDAIALALSSLLRAPENLGFYEPGDDLRVIVLTEEDDGGSLPPEHVAAALTSLPSRRGGAQISLLAVPWLECVFPVNLPRYHALVALTGGTALNSCSSPSLDLLPERPAPTTALALSQRPSSSVWVAEDGSFDLRPDSPSGPDGSMIEVRSSVPSRVAAYYLAGCTPPP